MVSIRTSSTEQLEIIVDENGQIRIPLLHPIQAVGKTTTELEAAVQEAYLTEKIYRTVTVHIYVPSLSYYVRGEIRAPGRYPLSQGRITFLQAIATGGGYTDFAAPGRIEIIRRGETLRVNAEDLDRHPERDIQVESGDVIVIPRARF